MDAAAIDYTDDLLEEGFSLSKSIVLRGNFQAFDEESLTRTIESVLNVERVSVKGENTAFVQLQEVQQAREVGESLFLDEDNPNVKVYKSGLNAIEAENLKIMHKMRSMEKERIEIERVHREEKQAWEKRFDEMEQLLKRLDVSQTVPKQPLILEEERVPSLGLPPTTPAVPIPTPRTRTPSPNSFPLHSVASTSTNFPQHTYSNPLYGAPSIASGNPLHRVASTPISNPYMRVPHNYYNYPTTSMAAGNPIPGIASTGYMNNQTAHAGNPLNRGASQSVIHVPIHATDDRVNIQVEHTVNSFSNRIKPFSGNSPRNGEATFEEWSKQIEIMLEDENISERSKRQKLLGSLHSQALDLARSMGDISPANIFKGLEDLYGSSANGVKLLQEFFKATMSQTETATQYLQRLSIQLRKVIKKGGLRPDQEDESILTHFKSTCRDDKICQILHVKYSSTLPPSIHELMKEVKKVEEDFGHPDQMYNKAAKARSNVQVVDETSHLKDQIDSIQSQLNEVSNLMALGFKNLNSAQCQVNQQSLPASTDNKAPKKKYKGFCYNCGATDGHYHERCNNSANPELVHKLLIEQQKRRSNSKGNAGHLNGQGPRL